VSDAQREAVKLAQFYFRRIAESAGWSWDSDNDVEIEIMVSHIIDAAAVPLRGQLDDALERIRQLENDLRGALAFIRVLDRLRPTCVICLDATADRQTVRGPACTDCVGDLEDDPDPEEPS
jgi:hypothetical protein